MNAKEKKMKYHLTHKEKENFSICNLFFNKKTTKFITSDINKVTCLRCLNKLESKTKIVKTLIVNNKYKILDINIKKIDEYYNRLYIQLILK